VTTEMNPGAANGAVAPSARRGRTGPGDRAGGGLDGLVDHGVDQEADQGAGIPDGIGRDEDADVEDGDQPEGSSAAGPGRGIWWAAGLLPFLSVAGAILCFSAGVLVSGDCQPAGSALCSGSGQWYAYGLPLLVSPLAAAVTAIAAVVHRRRSSWLALGYAVVVTSVAIGLTSASSGVL
jgi:hypothetical protein